MSKTATATPVCRRVFQNGAPAPTTDKYTQIWIALINRAEKNKKIHAELEQADRRTPVPVHLFLWKSWNGRSSTS